MPERKHNPDLPTAKEISPTYGTDHEDWDAAYARKNFQGKTLTEAELLFRDNALHYQEDLMHMGPDGFRYYVPAFTRYLESPDAVDDSDAVNCFASLIAYRLDWQPQTLAPVASLLVKTCQHILQQYDRFDLIPEIYGDLRPDYEAIITRLNKLNTD